MLTGRAIFAQKLHHCAGSLQHVISELGVHRTRVLLHAARGGNFEHNAIFVVACNCVMFAKRYLL